MEHEKERPNPYLTCPTALMPLLKPDLPLTHSSCVPVVVVLSVCYRRSSSADPWPFHFFFAAGMYDVVYALRPTPSLQAACMTTALQARAYAHARSDHLMRYRPEASARLMQSRHDVPDLPPSQWDPSFQ